MRNQRRSFRIQIVLPISYTTLTADEKQLVAAGKGGLLLTNSTSILPFKLIDSAPGSRASDQDNLLLRHIQVIDAKLNWLIERLGDENKGLTSQGETLDIGGNGLCFLTSEALAMGTLLRIKLKLSSTALSVELLAKVLRVEPRVNGSDYLLDRARVFGADAVVSGHYARVDADPREGSWRLRRAVDAEKDQTYFLFELTQEQLAAVRFPLGELEKSEVRAHARRLGLGTADKPESQEICFVPDGDYAAAVERIRPEALPGAGEIVDAGGRKLGRHAGVHRFTVGQRRGLGLGGGERLYVLELDAERNRVVVGDRRALEVGGARLERVNWIGGAPPRQPIEARVRIRYRHGGAPARIEPTPDGGARVHFAEPVAAVSPGQAAVFDAGDVVLGGGWIAAPLS